MLTDALQRAFARADSIRAAVPLARAPYPSPVPNGGVSLPGSGAAGWSSREQLSHFRGWVYGAVRPIAQRIAGQPVRLARRVKGGSPGTLKGAAPEWVKALRAGLEPVESHALLDSISDPNEVLVGWSLLYVTAVSLELTGRAYWFLDRSEGRTKIYPVPVSWVTPEHDRGRFFARYLVRPAGAAEPVTVSADDMVCFSYPDPSDPLGALSPLSAVRQSVATDEAIQTAQQRAFANGIHPGLAVIVGQEEVAPGVRARPRLTEAQRREIVNGILSRFRGLRGWDEPLILDALISDVKPITRDNREMDFLDSGAATKERITQGFGTNPFVMGQLENANRASAREAERHFVAFTVNPKIELLSQCASAWLLPRFGLDPREYVLFVEPCAVRDDEDERSRMGLAVCGGAVTVDELRGFAGLPPLPGGAGAVLVSPTSQGGVRATRVLLRGSSPSRNGRAK